MRTLNELNIKALRKVDRSNIIFIKTTNIYLYYLK